MSPSKLISLAVLNTEQNENEQNENEKKKNYANCRDHHILSYVTKLWCRKT